MAASAPSSAAVAGASAETPLIFPTVDALATELLEQLRALSTEAVSARGAFHVALSGGSLPATLAAALLGPAPADAAAPRKPLLDTSAWHWWFADERCVRKEDPDSNYAEANKKLFAFLPPIAPERMHAIDDALVEQTAQAAAAYESELRRVVPSGVLDVLLLGMGPDGHCCSLFPGHALLDAADAWIAPITDSPKPPPCRITMTLPLINQARLSLFVVTGGGKADALRTVVRERSSGGAVQSSFLPSSRVRSQRTLFLVDKAAAEKLEARL